MVDSNHRLDGQVTTNWDQALATRNARMRSSVIRELLKFTMEPDVISFAGGLPAPAAFPVRDFQDACAWVLSHDPELALQYGTTEGYPPLKQYLIEAMAKYNLPAAPSNLLFTNGSQQALDLLGKVFINAGDKIIVGLPTYLGAIQAWNVYGPNYIGVREEPDGMCLDDVQHVLETQPGVKFVYVLPNFHNPAGTTMTYEKRVRLVELAAKHGAFIIEDDPYGELRYEGEDILPICALHKENTIYLSTFSKTLAPGLRLGWIVAPEKVIGKLINAKQGADLNTSTLVQLVANDICQRGLIRAHTRKVRKMYRERRDVMLAAMEEQFPREVTWTRPQGGLFLWACMPSCIDADDLLKIAVQERVAFVPGHAFYPSNYDDGRSCMRLNFSYSEPAIIREGIARLGRAIKRQL